VIETIESGRASQLARVGDRVFWPVVATVLLLGAGLRLYRLDSQWLWLDELFTAQLLSDGPDMIWRYVAANYMLPLPMALFWLAAQLGGLTAISLRMVSVVAAIGALVFYYRYGALAAGRWTALLATALLAIAPLAVYYAQEARLYALPLLGQMLALLAFERLRRGGGKQGWLVYIALAVLAVQLQYTNLIPIGAQLLALLILARDRRAALLGGALTVLVTSASLAPFLHGTGSEMANWQLAAVKIEIFSTMQTIVAGDPRIASTIPRLIALTVVAIGIALALLDRRSWPVVLVHILQICLMLLFIFVLLPASGRPAPAYDERQFLVLLPGVLFVFSFGLRWLAVRKYGWPLAGILCLTLCATSATGLARYFGGFVKSPEGVMAATLGPHVGPNDIVVCSGQSYSVDAALRFYRPGLRVYTYRGDQNGEWMFASDTSLMQLRMTTEHRVALDEITQADHIWLVERGSQPSPYVATLLQQYQPMPTAYAAEPFLGRLLVRR
jgi:hypothetical protein